MTGWRDGGKGERGWGLQGGARVMKVSGKQKADGQSTCLPPEVADGWCVEGSSPRRQSAREND